MRLELIDADNGNGRRRPKPLLDLPRIPRPHRRKRDAGNALDTLFSDPSADISKAGDAHADASVRVRRSRSSSTHEQPPGDARKLGCRQTGQQTRWLATMDEVR